MHRVFETSNVMLKFVRLSLLRPIERFLTQWIWVSTAPASFVRERIRLGDATNFYRAGGFFLSAISTAFLAEGATLSLLGIGNLSEAYYWLFILLTSAPFILLCFPLVRLVSHLSFKDTVHLSLYPIGAGAFAGAALALVAAGVIAMLVAVGYIPEIKYDLTQAQNLIAVKQQLLDDCVKRESLTARILAAGYQEAFIQLKSPVDGLSYLRPAVTLLYFLVVACFFMAAVQTRKAVVFGLVLLASFVGTAATALSASIYLNRKIAVSSCQDNLFNRTMDRVAESALKKFALGLQAMPAVVDDRFGIFQSKHKSALSVGTIAPRHRSPMTNSMLWLGNPKRFGSRESVLNPTILF